MSIYDPLLEFMEARHEIYLARANGLPAPWTDDPILRTYSFTNVYRELDRTTIWIKDHWRRPDPDLFFAMAVARYVNLPATLEELTYPVPWNPDQFLQVLNDRRVLRLPMQGHAYMIKPDRAGGTTAQFLANRVLGPMWEKRATLRPQAGDTLQTFHARLIECYSVGSFMAGQIIADTKHADPNLMLVPDWFTWCCPGPGSQKGLSLLHDLPLQKAWSPSAFLEEVNNIQLYLIGRWPYPVPDAQDVQNCLCEYSKYHLAQLGIKRPKRLYPAR